MLYFSGNLGTLLFYSILFTKITSLQMFCYLPIKNKKKVKWLTVFNLHNIYSASFYKMLLSSFFKGTLLKERV